MHAGEPALLSAPSVPRRALLDYLTSVMGDLDGPLTAADQDWPSEVPIAATVVTEWESTAHAAGGVNCSGCHVRSDSLPENPVWVNGPTERECAACHGNEVEGFLAGRHGMRIARGLSPMRPGLARLPMKPEAAQLELSCSSCHSSHRFDTRTAAVDGCLTCHNDRHSLAYERSPHYALWQRELSAPEREGSGVSCATCHMPREEERIGGVDAVFVRHNQNENLRPNERMGRQVCMNCHGLEFTLDALADPQLIEANFTGQAAQRVTSVEMAVKRVAQPTN
jgi:formate-dependent nitrite reductase cytochrome c552 subunit